MHKKQISFVTFLLYLFFLHSSSNAQIKIHKHITVENGLVHNHVNRIMQDSKGYLWFATFGGISEWDGNNFINFNRTNGLTASQVFDIEEGLDSTIYIANFLGRVQTYKNGKLEEFNKQESPELKYVADIMKSKDGRIYFANGGTLQVFENNEIVRIARKMGIPRVGYEHVYEGRSGKIYLATWEGLYIISNDTLNHLSTADGLNNNRVRRIVQDKYNNLFIGTLTGLNKLSNGKISKVYFKNKPIADNIYDLIVTRDNVVYATCDNGVYVISDDNINHLTEENGLSDNDILSVFEDYNGTIYFGTQDYGVDIYHPDRFESYKINTKELRKNILSIYINNSGVKYFGTEEELVVDRNDNLKVINSNTFRSGRVNTIYKSLNNKIWFGTEYGITEYSNGNFNEHSLNQKRKDQNQVYSIIELPNKDIIFGSESGLYKFNQNVIKKLFDDNKPISNNISSVINLENDTILIGTHGFGINYYKDKIYYKINTSNGLTDNVINSLHISKDGKIYVGTDNGGLNIINNKSVINTIGIENGLLSNTILDINEDELGNIYLSTPRGINVITFNTGKTFVRKITKDDGLVSNNLNRNATYKDKNGNIWFGTTNGVSKYNPKADKPITNPPKIYLTGMEIFNEKYPLDTFIKENELQYDQNYLKFIYTGINLSAPEKIIYNYRLKGVDKNWVESSQSFVNYTSLDDGEYIFEVKARNEWGYWSEPTSLSFVINPAWWETWWFRLFIISTFGFMLWLAFQYRLNYLIKLERLRTKIASDLHDEVGSLLTQISINVDSLSYTKDEVKRKEKSSFIRDKSSEVINMMSDVIWSIDARNDNLESLVDRINSFALKFLEQKDILLNFNHNIVNLNKSLKIDFRQNVMMITKEAINNAVKYSECTKVDIDIKYDGNNFELIVSDNGKGIDFDNVNRGNGLKNMQMRAELINAELKFSNNNGCTIHLIKKKF